MRVPDIKKMYELADHLMKDQLPDGVSKFDMNVYYEKNGCNTAACVAGWAVALFSEEGEFERLGSTYMAIPKRARQILGLPGPLSEMAMFSNPTNMHELRYGDAITAEMASWALWGLADWVRGDDHDKSTLEKVWGQPEGSEEAGYLDTLMAGAINMIWEKIAKETANEER